MRNRWFTFAAAILALPSLVLAQSASMTSRIGKEDLRLWDGIDSTYSRATSTGGTLTLRKIGDLVDVAQVYGGGSASSAALQSAIGQIGTNRYAALSLAPGAWTMGANVTVPSNLMLVVQPGAVITLGNYTLTVSGWFRGQPGCILQAGSGTLVLAGKSSPSVDADWYYQGGNTWGSAINAAITCARASGIADVRLPSGTLRCDDATILLKNGVSVRGNGVRYTILKSDANRNVFQVAENLWEPSPGTQSTYDVMTDFTIDTTTNANSIYQLYSYMYTLNRLRIANIDFLGNASAAQGILLQQEEGGPYIYGVVIEHCAFDSLKNTSASLQIRQDTDNSNSRPNYNSVRYCRFTNWATTAIWIDGDDTEISQNLISLSSAAIDHVHQDGTGGLYFPVKVGAIEPRIVGNYFDGANNHVLIYAPSSSGTRRYGMIGPNQASSSDLRSYIYTPNTDMTYDTSTTTPLIAFVSTSQFQITGVDYRTRFAAGLGATGGQSVIAYCGPVDGYRRVYVTAVAYGGGNTTVTVTPAVLTSNLVSVANEGYLSYGAAKGYANYPFEGSNEQFRPNLKSSRFYTDRIYWGQQGTIYWDGILRGSSTVDPGSGGSIADGASASATVTVTGATTADKVIGIKYTKITTQKILYSAIVSSADTVTVTFFNKNGSSWTPGSGTLEVEVLTTGP